MLLKVRHYHPNVTPAAAGSAAELQFLPFRFLQETLSIMVIKVLSGSLDQPKVVEQPHNLP